MKGIFTVGAKRHFTGSLIDLNGRLHSFLSSEILLSFIIRNVQQEYSITRHICRNDPAMPMTSAENLLAAVYVK